MSKLAQIRAYQRSPEYAGDLFSTVAGLFKKGKSLVQKGGKFFSGIVQKGGQALEDVSSMAFPGEGGGGGRSGGGTRRRSRGITARELRGYRKVSNLLHKEGMVSRRARGRK